ncbi:MAG TPA: DUF5677 domain-containing protein [Rhodanobacteraceae bacterium]|nr:DUF5677 domain-containing protein [Rhodanobacteraceae bacterium]
MNEQRSNFEEFLSGYCKVVNDGFWSRWNQHTPEIYNNEVSEAIGGLVARQATLAIELARNPGIWNGHVAPLILRCMTDTHITLAWIVDAPQERSKEYIRFGLGQEKLFLEFLQNEADQIPEGEIDDEQLKEFIEIKKDWLQSQLMEWAIEVNVGSWSGKSAREMASETDCESLYKFAYIPFSGSVHSMWQHVGIYNVVHCKNPLHKNHRVPIIPELRSDPDYLYRSSKYVTRTYELLSRKLNLHCDVILPVEYFVDHQPFGSRNNSDDS